MILTQMINEVLRLHSLTPFIPRETEKNMNYKGKPQNCCMLKLDH
jgi:cytochrome P450